MDPISRYGSHYRRGEEGYAFLFGVVFPRHAMKAVAKKGQLKKG
jgi:hypothetical protein